MALAGSVITILGSTVVFVPQDITYLGFSASQLNSINPHLVPLIAHDRAGFGGGIACCGLTVLMIVWKARPTLALWQALLLGGVTGFGCAIGVHYPIGYLIVSHLARHGLARLFMRWGLSVCFRFAGCGDVSGRALDSMIQNDVDARRDLWRSWVVAGSCVWV